MPRGNHQRVPAPDELIEVGACCLCLTGWRLNADGAVKAHARSAVACHGSRRQPLRVVTMPAREYRAGMTLVAP